MEEHSILTRLRAREYLDAVQAKGRREIDPEMRSEACLLFDYADRMLKSGSLNDPVARSTFQLISDALAAEKYLSQNEKPRYVHYTNLPILDRYLRSHESAATQEKIDTTKRAIALILRDWHAQEQDRLTAYNPEGTDWPFLGFTRPTAGGDPVGHLKERERALSLLSEFAAVGDLPDTRVLRHDLLKYPSDWAYFAADKDRRLSHFACLPRSLWHDEVMFLRMILVTEACYAGILAVLEPLPQYTIRGDWKAATALLKNGIFFSDFLVKLWGIFETMPVPHFFDGFREATGDASAIQSVRFQTLDVLTRGLGGPKKAALSLQKEVGYAARLVPPDEASLPSLCRVAQGAGPEAHEFIDVCEILDRDLLQWRTKHYGIARKYLPAEAIGTGNEGVAYLAANFRTPRLVAGLVNRVPEPEGPPDGSGVELPIRATSAVRVRRSDAPPIAALFVAEVRTERARSATESRAAMLGEKIQSQADVIQRNMRGYQRFFAPNPFPLERQFEDFVRKNKLPHALAPRLLVCLELATGVLMGLHDASRIAGEVVFDTASQDESFMGIAGKDVKCAQDEFIFRDEKGIIASVFQGPDKRTAVHSEEAPSSRKWLLTVIGYPGICLEAFENATREAESFMKEICDGKVMKWMFHAQ